MGKDFCHGFVSNLDVADEQNHVRASDDVVGDGGGGGDAVEGGRLLLCDQIMAMFDLED